MADTTVRHPWLDLIDTDGPFLSRPALAELDDAWPPRLDPEVRKAIGPVPTSGPWPSNPEAAVDAFLTGPLGYQAGKTMDTTRREVAHGTYTNSTVTIHAVVHPNKKAEEPRMVVLSAADAVAAPSRFDPLTKSSTGGSWNPTPVQRAALAARSVGAPLALVTDGHRHLVVWVGSGVTGWGWIDPADYRLDRRLADATVALLKVDRVCTRTDTTTAELFRISQDRQAELTDTLGVQVRRAAEAVVNALSRANRAEPRLLKGLDAHDVYRGVVTVLMRTVFLLNAEENDLIGGEGMWTEDYAVSTLLDQLDDDSSRNPGLLSQRYAAWVRLLAAARAVHSGVEHDHMRVFGYGGGLFDPARHPFLEGRTVDGTQLDVGLVDDATIRYVLDLLQRLNGDRISYRTFSVEQIGQVYEHLLDHSAVTVPDDHIVLGLVGPRGAEPEIALEELEEHHSSDRALAKWIAGNYDHSSGGAKTKVDRWVKRIDGAPTDAVLATINQACRSNSLILEAVDPYLGMIDTDARGIAKVFLPGDVYVTETSVRRDSGTSYTSPAFAAEIAKHALRHLVHAVELPTDDDPDNGLKTPDEILDLKVCDPAVGSGAIIVAAVRYLAERLVASRREHGELRTDSASAATDLSATDPEVQAARDIVANCIYAVDRDPMAVEMTKLSLWLITMARNKPFTFIDHAIRSGDSLLGLTSLDQLRGFHLDNNRLVTDARDSGSPLLFNAYQDMVDAKIAKALELRAQVRAGDVVHPDEAARRAVISARADRELAELRLVADAITATCYTHAASKQTMTDDALRGNVLPDALDIDANREALAAIARRRPKDATGYFNFFHWAIEYPEVISDGGFDAMVGNPPFQGGKKIRGAAGVSYREHIIRYTAGGEAGSADLVAYFIRRAVEVGHSFGFIATNTVAQGDTRDIGLGPITEADKAGIYRAVSTEKWPGRDAVYVSKVWWASHADGRQAILDGMEVPGVESDLWPRGDAIGRPFRLPNQHGIVAQGQIVFGDSYILDGDDVVDLLEDPRNAEVIDRYIAGMDINSSPVHDSDRWVFNFQDWSLAKASSYSAFELAEERVKPQRAEKPDENARKYWWQYLRRRPDLVSRLAKLPRTIAIAQTSSRVMPVMIPSSSVFSNTVVVMPYDDMRLLGVLSSAIHRVWVDRYAATMKSDIRYLHSDVFSTFGFPVRLITTEGAVGDGLLASPLSVAIGTYMEGLSEWRADEMAKTGDGLTKFYGRLHDSDKHDAVTASLRERHVELDGLVAAAYGWEDLDLGHGFHDTRYGTFFTVSTKARFELLMRLLELNFVQYAEQTGTDLDEVKKKAQSHG